MTDQLTSLGQHAPSDLVQRPQFADDEGTVWREDQRLTADEPRLELLVPDGEAATETGAERRVAMALVDPDSTIRSVLVDHLRKLDIIAVGYDGLNDFLDAPASAVPTIAVIGPSEPPETLIPNVETFLRKRRRCGAVLLVFDLAPETVQQAFRAGIDDVVAVNAQDSELLTAIGRAKVRLQKHLDEEEQAAIIASVAPAVPLPVTPETGRILTVFGTKGGIGKSVVATNLAASLAQHVEGMVALVDLNLQFGDAAILLQLQPTHTIAEAAIAAERLDPDLLRDLLLRHDGTGVMVLAAPTEPGAADQIQRADLIRILTVLREMCAFVVVDTSPHLSDTALAALELADDIVMVANLDVMSLKNSRVSLQALQVLGISFSKIKFVLNRTNGTGPLAPGDAERVLQMKADAQLPEEACVAESVNLGLPVTVTAPSSKFAQGIGALAKALAGPSANRSKRRREPEFSNNGHDAVPESLERVAPARVEQVVERARPEPKRHWRRSRDRESRDREGTEEAESASV
jgi:pilus assembly protein CpaE